MQTKDAVKLLLFFVFTGLIGFMGAYGYEQQTLIREMKIGYNHAVIKSLTFTTMVLDIYLNFTNVSLIDINVEGYSLNVYVNDQFIVKLESVEPGYIAAQANSVVLLEVIIDIWKALGNIFSPQVMNALLFDYSRVIIRLRGVVSANHRGVEIKDIPVDISDNLQNLLYGTGT